MLTTAELDIWIFDIKETFSWGGSCLTHSTKLSGLWEKLKTEVRQTTLTSSMKTEGTHKTTASHASGEDMY